MSEEKSKPRLVVFAGPNGSGKSTLTKIAHEKDVDLPKLYINADEIARTKNLGVYEAAQEADKQRSEALLAGKSFTTETVMSTPGKLELMKEARERGYDVHLVYVTTKDPAINIHRVECRAANGGHSVPHEKIIGRYDRSMAQLPEALRIATTAEVYDNSLDKVKLIVEKTKEKKIVLYPQRYPKEWTQERLEKLIAKTPRELTQEGLEKFVKAKNINEILKVEGRPPFLSKAVNDPDVCREYKTQAKEILLKNGNKWPGEKADVLIAAEMLNKGYKYTSIRETIAKASPEIATCGIRHDAYSKKVVDQALKSPGLTQKRGIER